MQISFSISDTNVHKKLNDLARELKDFREPFDEIGDDLIDLYANKVFESRGGAVGDKWKDLSLLTLKARERRTGHYALAPKVTGRILIWTGALQEGFRKTVDSTKLIIDNQVEYFKYHQAARGKPPQRKMLAITANVIIIVNKRVNEYALKVLK